MDVMAFQRRGNGQPRNRATDRAAIAGVILAILLVLAALPGLAASGYGRGPGGVPEPMPVPAHASILLADFPEVANPSSGCLALATVSGAPSAPRSGRADAITGQLFQDACFGA